MKTNQDISQLKDKNWRMSHLYKIIDEKGELVTFNPNPVQQDFIKNRHTRNIILKSRRLGFTTYSAIDMMDNTLFNKNWNSLFLSYDDASSKKVFDEIIKLAWEHFPLKDSWKVDESNANTLKWDFGDKTYSSIEVKSSGRGGRYNHIHISEFGKICAKYPLKADEIIKGAIPALTPFSFLTIESTAEGETSYFHDMFWDAWDNQSKNFNELKPHEYKAHFYNWQWDTYKISLVTQPDAQIPKEFKDYQLKHNEKALRYPNLYQPITDIQLTYWFYKWIALGKKWNNLFQEFPTTPEEAFVSSGSKLFDSLALEKQLSYTLEPIRVQNNWRFYEEPKSNHQYIVAADPAEGVGGDHSAIVIMDFTPIKPKVVATFADNLIPPDLLAYEVATQAKFYNYALAMVERNNTGFATLTQLKQIYDPRYIYKEEKEDKEDTQQTDRLGWHTNMVTKPKMFYELSTAINENMIELVSKTLIHEARIYDRNELQKTSTDPDTTHHFDLLTALAICFQGRNFIQQTSNEIKTVNYHKSENTNFDPFSAV